MLFQSPEKHITKSLRTETFNQSLETVWLWIVAEEVGVNGVEHEKRLKYSFNKIYNRCLRFKKYSKQRVPDKG